MAQHSPHRRTVADPQLAGLLGDGLLATLGLTVPDRAPARRYRRRQVRARPH